MKISDDLEKLLPFGYLFLILMGILKDSIFYYQLGINILKYSTITDVLMSPISEFTSNPVILATIISLFIIHINLPTFLAKHYKKRYVQKMFELKPTTDLTTKETQSYYNLIAIKSLAVILLSFFLGYGMAGGYFIKKDIAKNAIKYDSKLYFNEDKPEQVFLINSNSLYYFYLKQGSDAIQIAPLGSVKNIEIPQSKGFFHR
ncbi:hypothetical protein [Flavobacterium sp. YJ01]|uniref:hypothetical protein n=1 Tax=unclassified Flavobacterium TaxID=196869 RepID=UPI0023E3D744|nr:hypothetical protein [Flavobacterium sp. YJ01]WET02659.1 hypothetical protein P0R33_23205 [Flavobacterium sp. YJ01]